MKTNYENQITEILIPVAKILDNNKASNIRILDLREQSSYLSFFVIANALTTSHSKKLCNDVLAFCSKKGITQVFSDKHKDYSGWQIIDFGSFLVHVFSEEQRDHYKLDEKWENAMEINWEK